jgi:hypothetical protein
MPGPHPVPPFLRADVAGSNRATARGPRRPALLPVLVRTRSHELC